MINSPIEDELVDSVPLSATLSIPELFGMVLAVLTVSHL